MSRRKLLQPVIGIILVILFLVGCGGPAATTVSETPAAVATPEQPATNPTPIPPTSTPEPPPPSCDLECTGSGSNDGPSLDIRITCETGEFPSVTTSSREWADDKEQWVTKVTSESDEISEAVTIWREWVDDKEQWVTRFEGMRTYKNSGNEYEIMATAYRAENAQGDWETKYYAEVTGGVFGETPKICENE